MRATWGKNWEPRTQGRGRISRYNVGYQARDLFFRHLHAQKMYKNLQKKYGSANFWRRRKFALGPEHSRRFAGPGLERQSFCLWSKLKFPLLFYSDEDDDGGFCFGVGNYNDDESPLQEGQPNPSGFEANFNFLFAETCFLCTNGCFFWQVQYFLT